MCIHLIVAENYIKQQGITEVWRGTPWTDNCREWVYFDCRFSPKDLIDQLRLEACIEEYDYSDIKAGSERGLYCNVCKDAVIGVHPDNEGYLKKKLVN